jgi:homogentisate 1,2-dioxygenase
LAAAAAAVVALHTGGASLHLCMTPHGPDTTTYESAIRDSAEQPAHLGRTTLAFMFETSLTPRVTPSALGSPCIDRDYYKCWRGLQSHFDRDWYSKQQQQKQQQPQSQQQAKAAGAAAGSNSLAAKVGELALQGPAVAAVPTQQ